MTKKLVRMESDIFAGTTLQELWDTYPPESTIEIDGWDDRIMIYHYRLETDEEEQKREERSKRARNAAAARKMKKEDADRALYEELKARFDL